MPSATLAPATCISNLGINAQPLAAQAQLYRDANGNGWVVILCVDPADHRSIDRIAELATVAYRRFYYGLPMDPAATAWLLHVPSHPAPAPCGGVYSPESWEHLRLAWADGEARNLRKPLEYCRLLAREDVESLIGGAL